MGRAANVSEMRCSGGGESSTRAPTVVETVVYEMRKKCKLWPGNRREGGTRGREAGKKEHVPPR